MSLEIRRVVELEEITGQRFVPVLIDPNMGTTIVDDDAKAVSYLEENYKN